MTYKVNKEKIVNFMNKRTGNHYMHSILKI